MKYIVSIWYVYGAFTLTSPIHEDHYITNDCESKYEEKFEEEKGNIEVYSQRGKDYARSIVGYHCRLAPDSEDWMEGYKIGPSGRILSKR